MFTSLSTSNVNNKSVAIYTINCASFLCGNSCSCQFNIDTAFVHPKLLKINREVTFLQFDNNFVAFRNTLLESNRKNFY